ncbi:MAG: hypothetical protein AAGC55_19090, partial [Myxococcota bacterium]
NAEIAETDLFDWLGAQMGPLVEDYTGTYLFDPTDFTVEGNWNTITELTTVAIGTDDEGMPVHDVPTTWIYGGRDEQTPNLPLTVTYEPAGCGRVLYSTYHTTDSVHNGLVPQERVLLYLIMEIGVCLDDPIIVD